MSVQEVENMTLAQKRMAAMIMENTVEEVEAHRARQAAAEAEAAAAVGSAGSGMIVDGNIQDEAVMEESDEEGESIVVAKKRLDEERLKEFARAQAMQANTSGPMKIRTDYVPKREYSLHSEFALTNSAYSGCKERKEHSDYLQHLRAADPCRRVAGAYAY